VAYRNNLGVWSSGTATHNDFSFGKVLPSLVGKFLTMRVVSCLEKVPGVREHRHFDSRISPIFFCLPVVG
jgi:hypothetical protein